MKKAGFPLTFASSENLLLLSLYPSLLPYYGKENFRIKQKVQNSLSKGNKFLIKWRKTYDNTISYNPEEMKAWYSEEYRGQSSGHYYILLDDTHATFKIER